MDNLGGASFKVVADTKSFMASLTAASRKYMAIYQERGYRQIAGLTPRDPERSR